MLTELQIGCLLIDSQTDQPVIMLQDLEGRRAIPIVIGITEAGAIASELERIRFPRPMTHDLLCHAIAALGATIDRVVITDLRDNTFFAHVVLRRTDEDPVRTHDESPLVAVDARPSDAIALAVRSNAPIFAASHVLDSAGVSTEETDETAAAAQEPAAAAEPPPPPASEASDVVLLPSSRDPAAMRNFLERLSPEDFGKYKM